MSLYATLLIDGSEYGDYSTPQVVRVHDWHSDLLQRMAFDGLGIFNMKQDAEALKAEYEAQFPRATYAVVDGAKVVDEIAVHYKLKDKFNPNNLTETITGSEAQSMQIWAATKS